jgi:hypothetical protein
MKYRQLALRLGIKKLGIKKSKRSLRKGNYPTPKDLERIIDKYRDYSNADLAEEYSEEAAIAHDIRMEARSCPIKRRFWQTYYGWSDFQPHILRV